MSWGFLFPGQGAQAVGMIADIAAEEGIVGERLEAASAVVDFDLAGIIREGPEDRLNQTAVTQPALVAVSAALHDVWMKRGGPAPAVVAGHSLGEYAALVAAGVLDFGDAVRLVHERGKLMQEAVPAGEGAMAAILGLDDEVVSACCASVEGVVTPANYNSPGQVVIAGARAPVDAAVEVCKDRGARRAVPLDVSVPSHCELMTPAARPLAELLDAIEMRDPTVPVVQNVTAQPASDAATIRKNLIAQLVSPVQWSQSVSAMATFGVRNFVECGPGNVLAGLARRIDRSLNVYPIDNIDRLATALGAKA
ncbi:MAG: ACP S-malonyltransferase [Gammaproteobacteria bacterium]|nr:ACP S-malonyltransferase [Gammaproteobacteria bacterium]